MVKSPAYSYYPDAFEQGTAMMTLAEVGAYQRLLNHQWATGSVPGDDPKRLAAILRCTPAQAKVIWAVVGQKFVRDASGAWCNARMEQERGKQQRRSEALSRNGTAGGRPKNDSVRKSHGFSGSRPETRVGTHEPEKLKQSLPSPSLSLERTPSLPPSRGRRRRITPQVHAEAEQIRKTQEVKRLIAEGLTFVDASRRVGFT